MGGTIPRPALVTRAMSNDGDRKPPRKRSAGSESTTDVLHRAEPEIGTNVPRGATSPRDPIQLGQYTDHHLGRRTCPQEQDEAVRVVVVVYPFACGRPSWGSQ